MHNPAENALTKRFLERNVPDERSTQRMFTGLAAGGWAGFAGAGAGLGFSLPFSATAGRSGAAM